MWDIARDRSSEYDPQGESAVGGEGDGSSAPTKNTVKKLKHGKRIRLMVTSDKSVSIRCVVLKESHPDQYLECHRKLMLA